MNQPTRVIHLTFHKCGSQWVRDVLTAPEIVTYSGIELQPTSLTLIASKWPEQPLGTFMGPIYDASYADWKLHSTGKDKAVVVLRDPRDLIISMVYSLCFSHRLNPVIEFIRNTLLPLDMRARILWGIALIASKYPLLSSWAQQDSTATEYITSYEKLVLNPKTEFSRIIEFFGWNVPEAIIESVVHRLSFRERSGRTAGDEDIFSHYRKGVPGDWRRHFDRDLGQYMESLMPDLLSSLKYEEDNQWYNGLEPSESAINPDELAQLQQLINMKAEMIRLREENTELRNASMALQARVIGLEQQLHQEPYPVSLFDAMITPTSRE